MKEKVKEKAKAKANNSKNGFTLIEVIVALAVLGVLSVCILGLDAAARRMTLRSTKLDDEYNLARAICERFRSETGEIESRIVVVYSDGIDEISGSISDIARFGIAAEGVSFNELKSTNYTNKKFIATLSSSQQEFLEVLEVAVYSSDCESSTNGARLRIARKRNAL